MIGIGTCSAHTPSNHQIPLISSGPISTWAFFFFVRQMMNLNGNPRMGGVCARERILGEPSLACFLGVGDGIIMTGRKAALLSLSYIKLLTKNQGPNPTSSPFTPGLGSHLPLAHLHACTHAKKSLFDDFFFQINSCRSLQRRIDREDT